MANSPGSRNRGKRGGAAAQGGGAPAPAGEADAGTSAQDPAPPNEEASSSRGDGAPPGADGAAAADVSDADEWEPLERPALGVPLAYVARRPRARVTQTQTQTQTACTRDAIPTLRRLVDLIGALETTFLQRYAPGQDLAKWNKKQDALLRRVGAAGAAPASAAEAFVAGIDDSELQRELHLPRLAAASRQGPAVGGEAPAQAAAPPVTPPVPRAGGPAGSRARRGGGRGRGGGGGGGGSRAAAAAA
jgi:hypothetical protein